MRELSTADKNPTARQGTLGAATTYLGDGSDLSPSIRQLILSFGGAVDEQTWKAEAYARLSLQRGAGREVVQGR